jgi:hypothetical protein
MAMPRALLAIAWVLALVAGIGCHAGSLTTGRPDSGFHPGPDGGSQPTGGDAASPVPGCVDAGTCSTADQAKWGAAVWDKSVWN